MYKKWHSTSRIAVKSKSSSVKLKVLMNFPVISNHKTVGLMLLVLYINQSEIRNLLRQGIKFHNQEDHY